ncbi:hypothetical protein FNYG_08108 [Fusarium nygamai]|uniref:Uncharacterized protein n=1 Tax=Gibberella nygamai TaxID=42673 RepID=A0A2K0W8E2_GIBNY|nr:hypothetical protein FNYG_08108 [Fusarium nygamai]
MTFTAAYLAAKENDKAWGSPHWLPKDVREAYDADEEVYDCSNVPNPGGLLRVYRVQEEVGQQPQKDLTEALREVEIALTCETGGGSNKEANHRLEGATLLRDRISIAIPSASAEEIKEEEDDPRGLLESRQLILEDMACIKEIMDAKTWYDEAMSKLEKKAKTANWMRFMDGGDA